MCLGNTSYLFPTPRMYREVNKRLSAHSSMGISPPVCLVTGLNEESIINPYSRLRSTESNSVFCSGSSRYSLFLGNQKHWFQRCIGVPLLVLDKYGMYLLTYYSIFRGFPARKLTPSLIRKKNAKITWSKNFIYSLFTIYWIFVNIWQKKRKKKTLWKS